MSDFQKLRLGCAPWGQYHPSFMAHAAASMSSQKQWQSSSDRTPHWASVIIAQDRNPRLSRHLNASKASKSLSDSPWSSVSSSFDPSAGPNKLRGTTLWNQQAPSRWISNCCKPSVFLPRPRIWRLCLPKEAYHMALLQGRVEIPPIGLQAPPASGSTAVSKAVKMMVPV